ncbi:MAG: HAD-IIA family hydrolase [Bacillota bacterium]
MLMDFSQFAAVLLDLDGTLYHEDHVLPGAVQLIARLHQEHRTFACLSNSTASPRQISQRLQRMGIQIDPDRIYPATEAVATYVLEKYPPRPRIFNLATSGLQELLDGKVDWVTSVHEPCHAVIAGAPSSVYATEDRQRAALLLLRNGAELVGICADRVFPSPRGLELGTGALCAMLAYAANVNPTFCGKPEKAFFLTLCRKLGVDPARCVLIGDNPESDIAGAKQFHMSTILLLTGITRRDDLPKLPPHLRPDVVVNDLTEL